MSPEQEFDRRIAAIHGIGRSPVDAHAFEKGAAMDVRHAELAAMADVFLGEDYDPEKRWQIDKLQFALHQQQAELSRRHDRGEINDQEYVNATNTAIETTFKACEWVLGPADFRKLFGVSLPEVAGLGSISLGCSGRSCRSGSA